MPLYAAFLQHYMHMPRHAAIWEIPFAAAVRLRVAYLELQGQPQNWGDNEFDAIIKRAHEILSTP